MGSSKGSSTSQGYRGACDQCSQRKVRCTVGNGACQNCVAWGKACIYSPKLPSGRPRKRTAASTGAKDTANQASAKLPVRREATPTQDPLDLQPNSSQNQVTFTQCSNSLSSIDSQPVTPFAGMTSFNFDDMELDMDLFYSNCFPDDTAICGQEYSSSLPSSTQENVNVSQADTIFSPALRHADTNQISAAFKHKSRTKPKPPPLVGLEHEPSGLVITPRLKTSGPDVPTFSSLLSTIMHLRSKYDSLKAYTQASLGHGQELHPETIKTIDQTVDSFSQYLNETGPCLSSIHQKVNGLATTAQGQQCSSLQATIQMMVAGFSIIIETSHILHELLHTLSSDENAISSRLDTVLRFSVTDFLLGQCEHSLGLVAEILSYGGPEMTELANISRELDSAKDSATSLRREFATAMEELKTPVF